MTTADSTHAAHLSRAAHGPTEGANVAEYFWQMARNQPDATALVCYARRPATANAEFTTTRFGALADQITRDVNALREAGIEPGMRAILMIRPSVEWFALTYALFHIGATVVLIDPGMGRKNLVNALASVRAQAFIGLPLAHLLRRWHARSFRTIRIPIVVGSAAGGLLGRSLAALRAARRAAAIGPAAPANAPAAILFTSGSTGPAKGVVYPHAVFAAQLHDLRTHFGCAPGDIDLATFPLFALFDVALGMTAVIPDMDATRPGTADPRKIIAAINQQRCTSLFASPALLRRVAAYGAAAGVRLPTLRRLLTAGAPIEPALLTGLRRMIVDDAEIHTPYGATEALPVCDIDDRAVLEAHATKNERGLGAICIGRPLPGRDVRIIPISDAPLADGTRIADIEEGQVGEIAVHGPIVTPAYDSLPDATRAAKISDHCGQLWHRMGDLGYRDRHGRIWYCGRKSHRVVTAAGTRFTEPCEAVFNAHPAVARCALVGVGRPGVAEPVICIELTPDARRIDRRILYQELRALALRHDHTRAISTFLVYPRTFPVDVRHNAKIRREELAIWAARQR